MARRQWDSPFSADQRYSVDINLANEMIGYLEESNINTSERRRFLLEKLSEENSTIALAIKLLYRCELLTETNFDDLATLESEFLLSHSYFLNFSIFYLETCTGDLLEQEQLDAIMKKISNIQSGDEDGNSFVDFLKNIQWDTLNRVSRQRAQDNISYRQNRM